MGKKVVDRTAFACLIKIRQMKKEMEGTGLTVPEIDKLMGHLNSVVSYLTDIAHNGTKSEAAIAEAEKRNEADRKRVGHRALLEDNQDEVKDMVVRGFGASDVRKFMYEKTGHTIHPATIKSWIREYKASTEYKESYREYLAGLDSVRLYTKIGRMEEYTMIYRDTYEKYKRNKSQTQLNNLVKILDQARKESDAPANFQFQLVQNQMNINGDVNFNMLDRKKELDVFRNMPLQEIILGRIARKTEQSPIIMMRRLQNSYYANQAGMNGLDKLDEEIKYPSEIHYNIEDMVSKQKAIQVEEAQIVIEEDNPDEEINPIKAAFLAKLEERKRKLAERDHGFKKED